MEERTQGPRRLTRSTSHAIGHPRLRRARAATASAFVAHAVAAGTLGARLPAIKDRVGLTDGELGVALTGYALGLFLGTRVASIPIRRLGSRAVVRVGTPLLAAALVAPGAATTLPLLVTAAFSLGVLSGVVDVAMNVQAVAVERLYRRPIMSSIHGMWSAGLLLGAAIGAGAAALHVAVPIHFASVGAALAASSLPALRGLLGSTEEREASDPDARHGRSSPRWSLLPARIILLCLICFGSFLGEGAAIDWSAVYLRDDLGTSAGVAAVGFVAFSLGMTAARFGADRLSARLGPVTVVRGGGLLAAGSLTAGLLQRSFIGAVIALVLFGVALAPVVPITISAAGAHVRGGGSRELAWVVTAGYVGSILGPAIIGLVAEHAGLRTALGIPAALSLVIAALAGSMASAIGARPGPAPPPHG
jgi:predicted MFS family arabinose efflux permease